MDKDWLALERDYGQRAQVLHRAGGEPMKAFRGLVQAAGRDGALPHRTKELIALAIAIADRNGLYGTTAFAAGCSDSGIQPIVGCELAIDFGDVDPNARKTLAAEMNTPTGYVEAASMNPTVFNDQFHMFASRKFAYDPAGPAQVNGQPVLIGTVENAAKSEHEEQKERKNFMKQKRKKPFVALSN